VNERNCKKVFFLSSKNIPRFGSHQYDDVCCARSPEDLTDCVVSTIAEPEYVEIPVFRFDSIVSSTDKNDGNFCIKSGGSSPGTAHDDIE
jgi:hypothetical protein